jgi:hypothetical protein
MSRLLYLLISSNKQNKMKKVLTVLLGGILVFSLHTCSSTRPASATPSGPRTIVLDGKEYTESTTGDFISWIGRDYGLSGPIRVEVGYFSKTTLNGLGFILFDGGYVGEVTNYKRTGLEHRWDWGPAGNEYSFILKTDGTGLYYDFTKLESGNTATASAVYRCRKL